MQNRFPLTIIPVKCGVGWKGLVALGLLCAMMGSLAVAFPVRGARTIAYKEQQQERTLVCVVSGDSGEPEMSMDAVVMIERGKLQQPFAEDNETAETRFANEYFATGREYRLTFGGGAAGTVKVTKWDKGCNNIHAIVAVKTSVKVTGQVRALATNSERLGSRSVARRAPTVAERAAVMRVVKQVYSSKGATQSHLLRITTTNLTATDLDGDGKYELVGSFVIDTGKKFRRDLFLITESGGASYKTAFIDYQSYKLAPEGFDSAIDFVDQLDLDGDGVGEVFAIQGGFDAYGYSIYKKQNGRWRKVYSATGDAC